jgi:hypothetical protein
MSVPCIIKIFKMASCKWQTGYVEISSISVRSCNRKETTKKQAETMRGGNTGRQRWPDRKRGREKEKTKIKERTKEARKEKQNSHN